MTLTYLLYINKAPKLENIINCICTRDYTKERIQSNGTDGLVERCEVLT